MRSRSLAIFECSTSSRSIPSAWCVCNVLCLMPAQCLAALCLHLYAPGLSTRELFGCLSRGVCHAVSITFPSWPRGMTSCVLLYTAGVMARLHLYRCGSAMLPITPSWACVSVLVPRWFRVRGVYRVTSVSSISNNSCTHMSVLAGALEQGGCTDIRNPFA